MSTMKEKREKITNFIVDLYNHLDPTKKNSAHFINLTSKMNDSQFIAEFTSLVNDPKRNLYLEIEAFENEPTFNMIEDAANKIVGDKYCHLYDYIAYPHLSDDPEHPVVSLNKMYTGYINMRRVQQIVNHKSHIPTDVSQRDPRTGQVTMHSKAARVSDVEQIAMIAQNNNNVIKELLGPRGGDMVMRTQMENAISNKGSVDLKDLTDAKINKPAIRTADVYFTSAALETDLITKNGVTVRVMKHAYNDAKSTATANDKYKKEGEE